MINHNLLFYHLFDRKFDICNNGRWTVNYTDGDLFELEKKLTMSEVKYPIIWLKSGYTVSEPLLGKTVTLSGCNFAFITIGDENDVYKRRYETNYQNMLYPLYIKFKEVFTKTRGIEIISETIDTVEYPFNDVTEIISRESKLGKKRESQSVAIQDIWDALFIDNLSITINEDCFPQFKIK